MPFRAQPTRQTRRSPRPPVPRHDGFSPAQQRLFLATLAACGSVVQAARAAGICRSTAYNHRNDPRAVDFREGWDEAVARAMAVLVDVALSRAIDGVEQPVFGVDGQIGTRIVYSDAMLRYLIERRFHFAPCTTTHHVDGRVSTTDRRTPRGLHKALDRIDPAGRVGKGATLSTLSMSHDRCAGAGAGAVSPDPSRPAP